MKTIFYTGFNEINKFAGIFIYLRARSCVSMILNIDNKNKIIPLSSNLKEKYKLIKDIECLINTKEKIPLISSINVNMRQSIKYYPVHLSFLNNKYILSIELSDSTFYFHINDIHEFLASLKEDMIFPGDRFIGLEAVELLDKRKGFWVWKAKCLLCEREIEIPITYLKINKSCGCLIGKNFDSDEDRFFSYVDKQENIPKELQIRGTLGLDEEPCWSWTGYKNKDGYGRVYINSKGVNAHRYLFGLCKNADFTPDVVICHRCDNPACVNPNHLFKGTRAINVKDMIDKGRDNKSFGEKHYKSKHTEKQVILARRDYLNGMNKRDIAIKYSINDSTVRDILSNRTWKQINSSIDVDKSIT